MKDILLIRHLESVKNLDQRFTASDDCSALTETGRQLGPQLAVGISTHFYKRGRRSSNNVLVVSSPAARAHETATFIANKCKSDLIIIDELKSFQMGKLTNVTEDEAKTSCPQFMKQLSLYRHGLFNSYHLQLPPGSELPRLFEARIQRGLRRALKVAQKRDVVFVLSRSVITGFLLFAARKSYNFPRNYYGYVELGVGRISWIQLNGGKWKIQGVDLSLEEFANG